MNQILFIPVESAPSCKRCGGGVSDGLVCSRCLETGGPYPNIKDRYNSAGDGQFICAFIGFLLLFFGFFPIGMELMNGPSYDGSYHVDRLWLVMFGLFACGAFLAGLGWVSCTREKMAILREMDDLEEEP